MYDVQLSLTIVLLAIFLTLPVLAQDSTERSVRFSDFLEGLAAAEEGINNLWARCEVKHFDRKDNVSLEYEWGYRDGMEFLRGREVLFYSRHGGAALWDNLLFAFDGEYLRTMSLDLKSGTVRYLDWSMAMRFTPITFTYRSPFKRLSEVLREGSISRFHTSFSERTGAYAAEIKAHLKQFDLSVTVDLERGFRPVFWEVYRPGTDLLTVRTEVQLIEAAPGLWLPKSGRRVGYFVYGYDYPESGEIVCINGFPSKLVKTPVWQLEVLEWRTGVRLPKETFQPKFPLGCKVWDGIKGIGYTVGGGIDDPTKWDLPLETPPPERNTQGPSVSARGGATQTVNREAGESTISDHGAAECDHEVLSASTGNSSHSAEALSLTRVLLRIGVVGLFAILAAFLTLRVVRGFQRNRA